LPWPFEDRDVDVAAIAAIATVTAPYVLHDEHRIRRGIGLAKLERERRRHVSRCDELHFLERLHAALRLPGLGGLGLEAIDEALQMGDRFLLLLVGALLQRKLLRAKDLELRVVAAVARHPSILQMQRDVAHRVQELAVMRNHDQRAGVAVQPVLEPDDRVEIEVIRRLVEQQQIGAAHQCLREVQPHAPAARKARDAFARLRERKAQPEQQRLGAGGRRIAIRIGEGCMLVGESLAVMGAFGRGDARFDLAQIGVAVERIFERRFLGGRCVLRHMRDAPGGRQRNIAGVGMQLTAQDGKERRLARAVCADESGFLARIEGERRGFEKGLDATREAELVETDHDGI
jgi:hypothetical protein